MITRSPISSGCAYKSPSSVDDAHCCFAALGDAGPSDATPVRALSPKYVVQCGPDADAPVVEVAPAATLVVVPEDRVDGALA